MIVKHSLSLTGLVLAAICLFSPIKSRAQILQSKDGQVSVNSDLFQPFVTSSAISAEPNPEPKGEARHGSATAPNAIYLELGGNALIWSVNFDRLITEHFSIRAGIGFLGLGTTDAGVSGSLTIIPITASYCPFSDEGGIPNSKFEVGAGIVYFNMTASTFGDSFSGSGIAGGLIAGYRYQQPDGGFLFRADFTPLIGGGFFIPMFGISGGVSF